MRHIHLAYPAHAALNLQVPIRYFVGSGPEIADGTNTGFCENGQKMAVYGLP